MTLEDKAPVPPAALLHSPFPTETLALSQPWGHCLTQAKTGCATCKDPNPKWSPKPLLTLPLFSCSQPYDPLALVERKPCPIITLYHTIYISGVSPLMWLLWAHLAHMWMLRQRIKTLVLAKGSMDCAVQLYHSQFECLPIWSKSILFSPHLNN